MAARGLKPSVALLIPAALWLSGAASLGGQAPEPAAIARFPHGESPIALTGPVRAGRYVEASGRRAALLGREEGTFEAWSYPIKVLHDFQLSFGTPAYAEPIDGRELATTVDVRPEGIVIRYTHAAFTVDATWLVPIDQPGGLVLLDVDSTVPLTIDVRFRPDLKLMWPAALGGQFSYWDRDIHGYVIGEAGRKHAAIVGSPFAETPPEQPAHNLPDAPSIFRIRLTPAQARAGLIPIGIVATTGGLDATKQAWTRLFASPAKDWQDAAAHARHLHEDLVTIQTPDPAIDSALEWGKVALDKGVVCNPDLGCGLVAGLGPSGSTERPGFGWYFGGDAFMNAWAIGAYGDFELVRQTLEFFSRYQRNDGKMPHEISQGAAYLKWFEQYPYAYYHADTTPLFISAVADYVRVSGDLDAGRRLWPAVEKAFTYCLAADEDDDGLMDNSRAGLAAVETGALRSADVQTDIYLATTWLDAAGSMASLARRFGETQTAKQAEDVYWKGREALARKFAAADAPLPFAVLKNGTTQGASTVWPALGLWRGHLTAKLPAVAKTLDELASPGVASDWGARMLSMRSPLYDPLSYNNGAVWPFVTGFAILGLYQQDRPAAAWQYLDALAQLTSLESRGFTAELYSGDRLRTVDAAVPHQLFATAGFVSGLLRGLVGFDGAPTAPSAQTVMTAPAAAADEPLVLRPVLPAGWRELTVRGLRWRQHKVNVHLAVQPDSVRIEVEATPGPLPIVVDLRLPPGADPASVRVGGRVTGRIAWEQAIRRPGVALIPEHRPLVAGEPSSRLRIVEVREDGDRVVARIAGRAGMDYLVDVEPVQNAPSVRADGATVRAETATTAGRSRLRLTFPSGDAGWREAQLTFVRTGKSK